MNLKRGLLLGAILLIAGLTFLQIYFNQRSWFGQGKDESKFNVGFLPVT